MLLLLFQGDATAPPAPAPQQLTGRPIRSRRWRSFDELEALRNELASRQVAAPTAPKPQPVSLRDAGNTLAMVLDEIKASQASPVLLAPKPRKTRVETRYADEEDDEAAISAAVYLLTH